MASKDRKYDDDDDEDYVPTKKVKYNENDDIIIIKKKKHTLDSDEEDNNDDDAANYDLKNEDIDGQESATIEIEGENIITPFNMKEELEEGHIDQDGFYHFKKDSQIKDAWLDNIDWQKVGSKGDNSQTYDGDNSSDSDIDLPSGNEENQQLVIYEQIITYLKEGETIAKALLRLGNKSKRLSSAERWKKKKLGLLKDSDAPDMTAFIKLTELCNEVIESGNMDIYQETYEMVALKILRSKSKAIKESTMDMFAEDDPSSSTMLTDSKIITDAKDTFDEISWEYKQSKEEMIHGPFSTEKMLKLQDSGEFKAGTVHVRKISEENEQWLQGSRIDFSIYL